MTPIRCIVSFGSGGWYPKGLARLRESCERFGVNFIGQSHYDNTIYNHDKYPYAFKLSMINKAMEAGYDTILWVDCSGWLQHDPTPIFEQIERDGYLLLNNHGQFNNWWCSDKQLDAFGYTREEARTQVHVVGGLWGVTNGDFEGGDLLGDMIENIRLFKGLHSNSFYTESLSDECRGNRHDQSVMSLIAAKHDLIITDQAGIVTFDPEQLDGIVAMRGM